MLLPSKSDKFSSVKPARHMCSNPKGKLSHGTQGRKIQKLLRGGGEERQKDLRSPSVDLQTGEQYLARCPTSFQWSCPTAQMNRLSLHSPYAGIRVMLWHQLVTIGFSQPEADGLC